MESFFTQFPRRYYDLNKDGNEKLVTDIFRRVKVRENLKTNASLFATYDVRNGDTPEVISYKMFGTVDYYWIILMMNDITDRYYGWPLDDYSFEQYVNDKYAEPGAVHHYEKTQSSGPTSGNGPGDYSHMVECNSTDTGAQSVSNYEYELRKQDALRQIKILDRRYLNVFVEEFEKIMSE